jgi:hypothetical protein
MEFKYKQVKQFEALIDIDDIGQCSLEITDSEGMCHYLIIRTLLGETTVFEYGPIVSDVQTLPDYVSCRISKSSYDIIKIKKTITTFISDRGRIKVENVRQLVMSEALNLCKDLITYMRQFDNERSLT